MIERWRQLLQKHALPRTSFNTYGATTIPSAIT
jgi:hypothetical protein